MGDATDQFRRPNRMVDTKFVVHDQVGELMTPLVFLL